MYVCKTEYIVSGNVVELRKKPELFTGYIGFAGFYLAVFNAGEEDSEIEIMLEDIEIEGKISGTELWSGENTAAEEKLSCPLYPKGHRSPSDAPEAARNGFAGAHRRTLALGI